MAARDLEARIQALEDTEAIKRVKAKYLYYMDAVHQDPKQAPKVVALFAEDGGFEFPGVGAGKGTADVASFFSKVFPGKFTFTMHMVHSPLIEVAGDKATGEWYAQVSVTLREGNKAVWSNGKYEDEFVREDGEWKFKKIVWKSIVDAPYEQGWAGSTITGWVKG